MVDVKLIESIYGVSLERIEETIDGDGWVYSDGKTIVVVTDKNGEVKKIVRVGSIVSLSARLIQKRLYKNWWLERRKDGVVTRILCKRYRCYCTVTWQPSGITEDWHPELLEVIE